MLEPLTTKKPGNSGRHVFVYGSLRRGDERDINRLAPPPRFVGEGVIAGVMYHLGTYPGVILGQGGEVMGEVYAIEPALERTLDGIEGIGPQEGDDYVKRQVLVMVGSRQITCLVYEVNPAYAKGKPVIAGGDWVKGRG